MTDAWLINQFRKICLKIQNNGFYKVIANNCEDDLRWVHPNLFTDRLIYNKVNTQLGITMTRRIFQFSRQEKKSCNRPSQKDGGRQS